MLSAPKKILATIIPITFIGLFYLFAVNQWDQRYLFFVAAIAATLIALWFCFSNLKRARLIEDTPTSKIRSAAQGYVELSGFARLPADQTILFAPLTLKQCLWFRYTIEEYRQSGKHSSWQIIEERRSDNYFELDDHSGKCLIDPRDAETTSLHRESWKGDTRNPLGISGASISANFGFGERYRYSEWRIHDGDIVYTLGHLQTRRGTSLNEQIQERQNEILSDLKLDQATLLKRFDSNSDGEISQVEWERARRHAQIQASKEITHIITDESISILGVSDQHSDQPFILSGIDPEILAKRYRWKAFGCAVGFIAGCLGTAWLITQLFGINALS
jgi:hypothetical protein